MRVFFFIPFAFDENRANGMKKNWKISNELINLELFFFLKYKTYSKDLFAGGFYT